MIVLWTCNQARITAHRKLINCGTPLFYVICQRSQMADRVNSWSVIIYMHLLSSSRFSFGNSAKRPLTPPGYTQRINLFCRLCTNQGPFFHLNRRWKSRKSAISPMSSITGRSPGYAESGGSPWGSPRAPGRPHVSSKDNTFFFLQKHLC